MFVIGSEYRVDGVEEDTTDSCSALLGALCKSNVVVHKDVHRGHRLCLPVGAVRMLGTEKV